MAFKRKRPGRFNRKPPPIFNRDHPSFIPKDSLSESVFPTNYAMPPTAPMNTQEIFNRFNKLLDWPLPPKNDNHNPNYSNQNRNFRDNTDGHFSPTNEIGSNSNNLAKRKITDPNDLRNRLDQQYKRLKNVDELDNYHGGRRGDIFDSDRINDNERGMSRFVKVGEKNWRNNRRDDDDLQVRRDHQSDPLGRDLNERWVRMEGDKVPTRNCGVPYDNFPSSNPDRMVHKDRNEPPPNVRIYTSKEEWAVNVEDSGRKVNEYRPEKNPFNVELRHHMSDDRRGDYSNEGGIDRPVDSDINLGRYQKEYDAPRSLQRTPFDNRDNREPIPARRDFEPNSMPRNFVPNSVQRDFELNSMPRNFEPNAVQRDFESNSMQRDFEPNSMQRDFEPNSMQRDFEPDSVRRERGPFFKDDRNDFHRKPHGDSEHFSEDFRDIPKRMPPFDEDYDPKPSNSRMDGTKPSSNSNLRRNPNEDDLTVIIHKPNNDKITYAEGDSLRSMLIDLVMNCGNPEQMPEFLRSGITWGGKGFYVFCRNKDTMDWLLKLELPPLNGIKLLMRRNKMMEIVKISAFAPRCVRTKDEVFKLLKLQNGKKGFNFNNWAMRSYQVTPKGVYMAFDIGLDEAQVLYDLGCELSFELKTLTFKISPNTIQKVTEFPK